MHVATDQLTGANAMRMPIETELNELRQLGFTGTLTQHDGCRIAKGDMTPAIERELRSRGYDPCQFERKEFAAVTTDVLVEWQ